MGVVRIIRIEGKDAFGSSVRRFLKGYDFSKSEVILSFYSELLIRHKIVSKKRFRDAGKENTLNELFGSVVSEAIDRLKPEEKLNLYYEMTEYLHEKWVESVIPDSYVFYGKDEYLLLPLAFTGVNALTVYYQNTGALRRIFHTKILNVERMNAISVTRIKAMLNKYQVEDSEGIAGMISKVNSERVFAHSPVLRVMNLSPYDEYVAGQLYDQLPVVGNTILEARIAKKEKEKSILAKKIKTEKAREDDLYTSLFTEKTEIIHSRYGTGVLSSVDREKETGKAVFPKGEKKLKFSYLLGSEDVFVQKEKMKSLVKYLDYCESREVNEFILNEMDRYISEMKGSIKE